MTELPVSLPKTPRPPAWPKGCYWGAWARHPEFSVPVHGHLCGRRAGHQLAPAPRPAWQRGRGGLTAAVTRPAEPGPCAAHQPGILWEAGAALSRTRPRPMAAYDKRACWAPWLEHTAGLDCARCAGLAHCIVSATAFWIWTPWWSMALRPRAAAGAVRGRAPALADYNWEGLHQPPRLGLGTMSSDARALGGALLPLHACFAPDTDIFLKA